MKGVKIALVIAVIGFLAVLFYYDARLGGLGAAGVLGTALGLSGRKNLPSAGELAEQASKRLAEGEKRVEDAKTTAGAVADSVGRGESAVDDGLAVLDAIKKSNQ